MSVNLDKNQFPNLPFPSFSESTLPSSPSPHQRPTSRSHNSTVESFSGPKLSTLPPPDDYRSDCGSSSSVVDNDDHGDMALSSFRKPLPFDLNFPPAADDTDDFQCTALCL
ncbi:ethylene-responsive transcription factor 3-like [Magnolia sinica]|uniref:ethylene-responsive transcription factor 3-like n=1 Tax=Magnolia sinica TaxID=86752 RepID=UPI0026591AE6|nr:ethylene-responsive transcription factor 3-like [Magnolia sinica]